MKSKRGGRRGEKLRRGMRSGDMRFRQVNDQSCGSHKRSGILQGRRRLMTWMSFPWSKIHRVHCLSWQRFLKCRKYVEDDYKDLKNCWCYCCWCRSSCTALGRISPRMMDSHGPRSVEASRFGTIQGQDWRTLFSRIWPLCLPLSN